MSVSAACVTGYGQSDAIGSDSDRTCGLKSGQRPDVRERWRKKKERDRENEGKREEKCNCASCSFVVVS